MRVLAPIHVQVQGLFPRKHQFTSSDQVLGELETGLIWQESRFGQVDGAQFTIRRKTLWPARYVVRHDNTELATAECMDITYRAIPYYLGQGSLFGPYQLRNEQDTVVLEISRRNLMSATTEIEMTRDAELPLVVLAYFLVRLHRRRRQARVGGSK